MPIGGSDDGDALLGDLTIRAPQISDRDDILRWRNDSVTRAMSLNADAIDQCTHERWFSKILSDSEQFFYVGILSGFAVGWVRFDPLLGHQNFRANIVISPESRGRKIGSSLLAMSILALCAAHPGAEIEAQVKRSNPASLRLFFGRGFVSDHDDDDDEFATLRLATSAISAYDTQR